MKSIEMNSSTKLAKLMKDYDLLIEIDNTREYFGKVVYKIPMEPKYYVIHSVINLTQKYIKYDMPKNDFLSAYLDYSKINSQEEDILSILYYNLQISSFFTLFYSEYSNKNNKISFGEVLDYSFNEKKPFNIIVSYKNETELNKFLDEFINSFQKHYHINIENTKAQLENQIKSKNKYDIFEEEVFKTNQPFFKHIYFVNHKENESLKSYITKTFLDLLKDFYNDTYEGSFPTFIERTISTKHFFNKFSYEYQYYNNSNKIVPFHKIFNLIVDDIQKSSDCYTYKLKKI